MHQIGYITRILCQRMMPEWEKQLLEDPLRIYETHDQCHILTDGQKHTLDMACHLATIITGKTPTQKKNQNSEGSKQPVQKLCKNICDFADKEKVLKITKWMSDYKDNMPEEDKEYKKMVCDWLTAAMEGKTCGDIAKNEKYSAYKQKFRDTYKKKHGKDCTTVQFRKKFHDHILYEVSKLLKEILKNISVKNR